MCQFYAERVVTLIYEMEEFNLMYHLLSIPTAIKS